MQSHEKLRLARVKCFTVGHREFVQRIRSKYGSTALVSNIKMVLPSTKPSRIISQLFRNFFAVQQYVYAIFFD